VKGIIRFSLGYIKDIFYGQVWPEDLKFSVFLMKLSDLSVLYSYYDMKKETKFCL
jgi:hypothetical protein